jgi:hypothetical protein
MPTAYNKRSRRFHLVFLRVRVTFSSSTGVLTGLSATECPKAFDGSKDMDDVVGSQVAGSGPSPMLKARPEIAWRKSIVIQHYSSMLQTQQRERGNVRIEDIHMKKQDRKRHQEGMRLEGSLSKRNGHRLWGIVSISVQDIPKD